MKKFRLLIVTLIALLVLPFCVNADKKDLVKVYVFSAGGCPYCEQEIEYLKGLDTYNKEFEIVEKELYVDHVDWEQGKDYDLGVVVANAFNEAGFENASYSGTPFVVISDLYASTGYSESLEDIINKAVEEGDKDVVGCYAKGNSDCGLDVSEYVLNNSEEEKEKNDNTTIIIIAVALIGFVALFYFARDTEEPEKKEVVKETKKEEKVTTKKPAAKKTTTPKKTTTKKPATKKPVAKKTTKKATSKKTTKK